MSAFLPDYVKKPLKRMLRAQNDENPKALGEDPSSEGCRSSLDWMPAARYQPIWPKMPAFALPSFYDGRIRINLQGRERKGIVPLEEYEFRCEEIRQILMECRDPFSGQCVVDHIEWAGEQSALELAASRADINVSWKGSPLCLEHPEFGRVGPVPFRRTGGHTGLYGMAYLKSDNLRAGDYGIRSSFDVVPTLFALLGERLPEKISGHSFVSQLGS